MPVAGVRDGCVGDWRGEWEDSFEAFHWHRDTFDLPDGAVRLASTPVCENQMFSMGGRILGIQFHLEMYPDTIEALMERCPEDTAAGGAFCQDAETIRSGMARSANANARFCDLLDRLATRLRVGDGTPR